MGHSEANNAAPGAEISAAAIPEEPDWQHRNPENSGDVEIATKTEGQQQPPEERNRAVNTKPRPKKSLPFKLAFVGLAASLFVFQMDSTCLGIALPTIAGDLKGSSLELFWANLAYTLCGLVTQPAWASFSNAFGRKPPLYVSMGLFFIGSIVFAVAQNMNTIIVGRVFQGLGGGGIDVLASAILAILADMTTLEERSKYLALMAIPSAIGNIMGPTVGALFSTYATWRWI